MKSDEFANILSLRIQYRSIKLANFVLNKLRCNTCGRRSLDLGVLDAASANIVVYNAAWLVWSYHGTAQSNLSTSNQRLESLKAEEVSEFKTVTSLNQCGFFPTHGCKM